MAVHRIATSTSTTSVNTASFTMLVNVVYYYIRCEVVDSAVFMISANVLEGQSRKGSSSPF